MDCRFWLLVSRDHAQAFPQSLPQRDRPPLLPQQITERLVRHFLQALAGLKAQVLQRMPDMVVELDAAANGQRPAVYVQWGKHGSMPAGWQRQEIERDEGDAEAEFLPSDGPITLERFNRAAFDKLSKAGARHADHPLARRGGWPARFTGAWTDFSTFSRSVDALALLKSRRMVLVSRWNSATINRHFLRYNFKPKLEWPDDD